MGLTAWLSGQALAAEEGKITIVMPEELDIVDPCHASRSNIGRVVKQNVAETLTEINPDDASITPRLATSWERIDDRTWRFQLREGVVFHDGTPMDAEAVATSINRTLNPEPRLRDPHQVLRQHHGHAEGRRQLYARPRDRRAVADPADHDGHGDGPGARARRWTS